MSNRNALTAGAGAGAEGLATGLTTRCSWPYRGYLVKSGLVTMDGDANVMLSHPKIWAAFLGND